MLPQAKSAAFGRRPTQVRNSYICMRFFRAESRKSAYNQSLLRCMVLDIVIARQAAQIELVGADILSGVADLVKILKRAKVAHKIAKAPRFHHTGSDLRPQILYSTLRLCAFA
jgi:hypothetical protein